MRPAFLPQAEGPALVHTLEDCRQAQRSYFMRGLSVGALVAVALCLGAGIGLSRWQEQIFDSQMRIVQAQHRAQIEYERKRLARYAEIAALADQLEAAQARRGRP